MIKKGLIFLIMPILILQGCASASRSNTTLSVPVLPTIEYFHTLTTTPMPSSTQTKTATQTRIVTPTSTVTVTPLPTLTFLPTVPNPREELVELYGTNGGCKLPCWWGITPGETTIQEVQNYFRQFSGEVGFEGSEFYGWVTMYYPPANSSIDYAVTTRLLMNDQIVEAISLDYEATMWGGFFPARMLKEYGEPDQIYVTSDDENISFLAFYYSTKRFFAEYQLSIEGDGDNKKACFVAFGSLVTWSGNMPAINQFTQGRYSINSDEDFLQADMAQFYENLKAKPTSFCFPYETSR